MSRCLTVLSAGPGVTIQDMGRPGLLAVGVSRGGAMDTLALAEGAALLGQPVSSALELAGFGGKFKFSTATRIALTGAPMRAALEGVALAWQASHLVQPDEVLEISSVTSGAFGYLTLGGGLDMPDILGAQSAHLTAGLGRAIAAGDILPLGKDKGTETGLCLDPAPRWSGGTIRILPSLQTDLFPPEQRDRFTACTFARDTRANRMGLRLIPEGEGFGLTAGQSILSEIIVPGDIQIPGDGAPYVLMSECQTTGGYPRIGTVIPADLPLVGQCPAGAALRFRFVTRDEALTVQAAYMRHLTDLPRSPRPRVRDIQAIQDLLAYNLISGMITGEDIP